MIPISKLVGRLGNNMFQYAYMYAQARDGLIPDVYVQSEDYFDGYQGEIRAIFSEDVPNPIDMVAIHVRRGDYVNNSFYVDLMQTDYYEKAMEEFPGEKFIIFSDDIAWCKQQPLFKGCEFSTGKSEIEDLNLMAACKGVIMANSSFSWWGAWLSRGKIIAPQEWYSDGEERTICPPSWTKI